MKILFYRRWCRHSRRLFGFMLMDMALWAFIFVGVYAVLAEAPEELMWFLVGGLILQMAAFDSLHYQR